MAADGTDVDAVMDAVMKTESKTPPFVVLASFRAHHSSEPLQKIRNLQPLRTRFACASTVAPSLELNLQLDDTVEENDFNSDLLTLASVASESEADVPERWHIHHLRIDFQFWASSIRRYMTVFCRFLKRWSTDGHFDTLQSLQLCGTVANRDFHPFLFTLLTSILGGSAMAQGSFQSLETDTLFLLHPPANELISLLPLWQTCKSFDTFTGEFFAAPARLHHWHSVCRHYDVR